MPETPAQEPADARRQPDGGIGQWWARHGAGRQFPLGPALVHVFTASGIVCALAATLALYRGAYVAMFVWLAVAFVIDGVDGALARAVDVKGRLPRFSGEQLDLVIDYITYVFVPALALLHAGFLTGWLGTALAALILMSSLFHFSDTASKTADHCFVGFPAIWNIVAFYIFAYAPPGWLASIVVLVLAGLTFVPMRWLHPLRVRRFRALNIALLGLWMAMASWILWTGFPAGLWPSLILAGVAIYGISQTLAMPWRETPKATP